MAAQAWKFYNSFKEYMADNTIDLDGDTFGYALFTSASNFATATLSVLGSVTSQVTSGNGYSSSGKALTGVTWATGASASEMRFDATAVIWSASGGSIANVKAAVLYVRGASALAARLVAYASLSSGQFTIGDGNTLTITPSANGIFELN